MIQLLFQQQYALFILIMIALIISLTFHEYGHAIVAKLYGDDTAQKAGRLTLNPVAHIDPGGLLMVVLVGFGYAKPVPTNPANFSSRWATLWVSAAGPGMNLLVAIFTINLYILGLEAGWSLFEGQGPQFFFIFLAKINLLLMLFNLIPIGPLDGHYILPYFPAPVVGHAVSLLQSTLWGLCPVRANRTEPDRCSDTYNGLEYWKFTIADYCFCLNKHTS